MSNTKNTKAIVYAILAAALYAINSPISKLLLDKLSATMMAALLYLGAGIGLVILNLFSKRKYQRDRELPLTKSELPFVIMMVVLDIAAPILLLIGLSRTTAANVSLLNNFEIAATTVIALLIFHERITKRLWIGIGLVTMASMIISIEDFSSFSFSYGSLLVLLACICWGFENNSTRRLSSKNPIHIVIIKGLGSGMGSFMIARFLGETAGNIGYVILALCLGFVSYGLSIVCYIYAQRYLGAAKTSAYYALAPFIGAGLSCVILKELPSFRFMAALVIMIIGTYFVSFNEKKGVKDEIK